MGSSRFERDSGYRGRYFSKHNGFLGIYVCAYCGKLMLRRSVTVDHIIPVNRAKTSLLCRLFVVSQKKEGINASNNLVAACRQCNSRKGKKGGWWILRGLYGQYVFPALWATIIGAAIYIGFFHSTDVKIILLKILEIISKTTKYKI